MTESNDSIKIKANNLQKIFKTGRNKVVAIDDLDIEINEGQFAVIVGPSGCGKSTFLYMIAGFEKPSAGELYLDGELIKKPGRNRGFVFQDFALYPWKTVKGNIKLPLEIQEMPEKYSQS